jgi:acetyl-CoA carboxylase carboxyl transferase subunit alpha
MWSAGCVKEPVGGAHQDPEKMAATLKAQIVKDMYELGLKDTDQLITERIDKFCAMGMVTED